MDLTKTIEVQPAKKPTSMDAAIVAGPVIGAALVSLTLLQQPNQAAAGAISIELVVMLLMVAAFVLRFVRRAFGGPVAFFSPAGFSYPRLFKKPVPWTAINRISWQQKGMYRFMILRLDPQFAKTFRASRLYRTKDALGATELNIPSHRLAMPLDTLLATANAYWDEARGIPASSSADVAATPLSKRESIRLAWATIGLLLVLCAAFGLEVYLAPDGQGALNLAPLTLAQDGGMARMLVEHGQWWRFFTAPLLHAGPSHLFNNALALTLGGFVLERRIGWQWFIAIFGVSALAGGVASCLFNAVNVVSVGASGGIVGLFAAVVVLAFREPDSSSRNKLLLLALRLLVPTLLPTQKGGSLAIDIHAHLGGTAGGLVMGLLISALWLAAEGRPRQSRLVLAVSSAWMAATAVALIFDVVT